MFLGLNSKIMGETVAFELLHTRRDTRHSGKETRQVWRAPYNRDKLQQACIENNAPFSQWRHQEIIDCPEIVRSRVQTQPQSLRQIK